MRGMNGSSQQENRGYSGGLPPPGAGAQGMGPGAMAGLGFSGAPPGLGMPIPGSLGNLGGPELKHHADFLSRLLAATPSYMSELGNPPPGFFSDWLRRLVSKPTGNSGGGGGGGSLQSSGLTFPGGGHPETERLAGGGGGNISSGGGASVPSTTPGPTSLDAQISSKRRKRSRLNDHPEHPLGGSSGGLGGGSSNLNDPDRPSPNSMSGGGHHVPPTSISASSLTPNANSIPNSASSPSGSSASAAQAAAAAAAAFQPLGAYPFWFFPPFMHNPYGMGMNMGMNFPGHGGASQGAPGHPGQGAGLSAAAQAAAISSYLGGTSPAELFRTDNLNLLSGSITSSPGGARGGLNAASPHSLFPPPGLPPPLDGGNHHPQHHQHSSQGNPHGSKLNRMLDSKGKESPPTSGMKDPPSFLAAAAAAASASFLLGSGGTSNALPKQNNQHQLPSPSSSHYSSNHNGGGGGHHHHHSHHSSKMSGKSAPSSHTKGNSSKSSSFSISRLTSPSPSSNSSSGGSCSGSNSRYHGGNPHYQPGHGQNPHRSPGSTGGHLRTGTSSTSSFSRDEEKGRDSYPDTKPNLSSNNSGTKLSKESPTPGISTGGGGGDAGLCVDLRVSGRIWESSSGAGPAPRSIYTPLSAFRDPADVNLYNSSPQVPRYEPAQTGQQRASPSQEQAYSPTNLSPPNSSQNVAGSSLLPQILQQKTYAHNSNKTTKNLLFPSAHLSTKYVLQNIQHIYHRIRPSPGSRTSSPSSRSGGGGISSLNTTVPTINTNNSSPNQITPNTTHPINNNHSPPSTAAKSPLSQQLASSINHHQNHPHLSASLNHTEERAGKKPRRTLSNASTNNNSDSELNPDEETAASSQTNLKNDNFNDDDDDNQNDNDNSRPQSSTSSILDDDDFKPEAELKIPIRPVRDALNSLKSLSSLNSLNLSLNNNNVIEKKVTTKYNLEEDKTPSDLDVKIELPDLSNRKSPSDNKRKSSSLVSDDEEEDEFNSKSSKLDLHDNPYKFVDTDKPKNNSKKLRKENNNEIEEGGKVSKLKIKIPSSTAHLISKDPVLKEDPANNHGDDDDEDSINIMSEPEDIDEQVQGSS